MRRLGTAEWGFDFTPEQIRDMRERDPALDRCDDCGTEFGLEWSVKDELPLCLGCYERRHGDDLRHSMLPTEKLEKAGNIDRKSDVSRTATRSTDTS
jgi:hypothetical protein